MCFEGIARLSRRVWRRFVRGSREISLVPSLHRASTDALIKARAEYNGTTVQCLINAGYSDQSDNVSLTIQGKYIL